MTRALVTEPGVAHSTRVEQVVAGDGEVLLRPIEVGVCGTDREIAHGLFGEAPAAGAPLVLGHEVLAVVAQDGGGFSEGDLVTATVRRPCGHCLACGEGAPDSCLTGDYCERGITRLNGFACDLLGEDGDQLIPVPRSLDRLGVLAEPTSICERALRHARAIGGRQPWQLRRALVLGAGAIGTITTLLLRLQGIETWVASLEPDAPLVEAAGARYARVDDVGELGAFDLVVECAGNAQLMADALGLLRRSGVACLIGIDGRNQAVTLDGRVLALDTVVEGRVVFGSVNAHRQDWLAAVEDLARIDPGLLRDLVGLRVPLEQFEDAFAFRGGKATLVLDG
ncbi:MAG TPA: alcohol dehydrogenase catalytic domain-containing protein [Gaiellaceae bacterium]|jgi:threonine dehydrogenase-like Zn-dependent dehydrogenase